MLRRLRAGVIPLLGLLVVAAACQPVDEIDDVLTDTSGENRVRDLDALAERVEPTASEWDADGRLVEVAVRLDEDREWLGARATFVAPDAERMLVVAVDEDGVTEQEPTLETLGFLPPTATALMEVPILPARMVEPDVAAEAAVEALGDCRIAGHPREVVYLTGVPGSWDGTAWTTEPAWKVSVLAEGGGVRLGTDGTPLEEPCFEVP